MGLKDRDEAFRSAQAGGVKRGVDLGRMMAVIVNDRDAVHLSLDLKAPVGGAKVLQTLSDLVRGKIEFKPDGDGGKSVLHIVPAGHRDGKGAETLALQC